MRLLAAHGAQVVVKDIGVRKGADAAAVVEEITHSGGTAVASTASAIWDGAQAIVATAMDTFGRVDILINNAMVGHYCDLWEEQEEQYDTTLGVNLKGYFALIKHAVAPMATQGGGAIVNTSSASGYGHPARSLYGTAKEGVVGLTRTVASELGRFGIRCNAIRPQASGQSGADYSTVTAHDRQPNGVGSRQPRHDRAHLASRRSGESLRVRRPSRSARIRLSSGPPAWQENRDHHSIRLPESLRPGIAADRGGFHPA
jgi:NAD(P)-dependent dehydrogenase (short-subunit alcohol dehydrogenase family)